MKAGAVFFDFDSTVVTKETLDEVVALALGERKDKKALVKEIEAITRLGMEGKLPFTQSLTRRIHVAPLSREHFTEVGEMMLEHITEGMPEIFAWLREQKVPTYIVSGGVRECIAPVAEHLGVPAAHTMTNEALFSKKGQLIGMNTKSLLWSDEGKGGAIRHVKKTAGLGTCVLVGDGSNDLAAYTNGAVELFCGFGANVVRKAVRAKAPQWAASSEELGAWLRTLQ